MGTPMPTPMSAAGKKIILLRPRGFCAGVVRAIDVVKIALNMYGAPIYVRKEIVHNRHVVCDPERVSCMTQTALSLDENRDIVVRLKEKFPKIQGRVLQDICYATE